MDKVVYNHISDPAYHGWKFYHSLGGWKWESTGITSIDSAKNAANGPVGEEYLGYNVYPITQLRKDEGYFILIKLSKRRGDLQVNMFINTYILNDRIKVDKFHNSLLIGKDISDWILTCDNSTKYAKALSDVNVFYNKESKEHGWSLEHL